MGSWYTVSFLGWLVTIIHTTLTAVVVHGFWVFDRRTEEIELLRGAAIIYAMLVAILLYARYKKVHIFKASHGRHKSKRK